MNILKSKYNQNKELLLILLCYFLIGLGLTQPFCHTSCIDYVGACFDVTENSCYVCASNIYKDKDFTNPLNPCVLKEQRKVFYNQLNSKSMSLIGYTTSVTNAKVCGNLTFSGTYVKDDYISKNFTNINAQHYELIIRFNVGYFGTWSQGDNLKLQIDDGVSITHHTWNYTCGAIVTQNGTDDYTENLCSAQGTDCVRIKQFIIQHNASFVNLKWAALISETDPNVKNWGIKDVIIVGKTCHRYCGQCYGQKVSQCLTCSIGYFLRGNTCVQRCPKISLLSTRECVDSCPSGYYHNLLNDVCQKCLDGCTLCSGSSHCLLWQSQTPQSNLFTQKLQLWIIMIIGGVGIIGLLLWKFVLKKYFQLEPSDGSNQSADRKSRIKQNQSNYSGQINELSNTNQNITNHLWMQSIDNIDPVRVDIRKRKKRKADTNNLITPGNTETNL